MSNSHECKGVNREAMQLHAVTKKKKNNLDHKSHKKLYQVLQIICAASEHAKKSKACMIISLSA